MGKKNIVTLNFFIDTYIFSDRRSKNHKIFIFHFLSTFLEIFSGIYLISVCQLMGWSRDYHFKTIDEIYNTWLHNRLVSFGTQFLENLFLQKIFNRIVGVISGISFDSQDIF